MPSNREEVRRLRDEEGLTFRVIGERLGMTKAGAHAAYYYSTTDAGRGRQRGPANRKSAADYDASRLSPVARVLLAGMEAAKVSQHAIGLPQTTVASLLSGHRADPRLSTVAALLAAIRPGDKDGGWGWFGRELSKESRRTSPAAAE